MKALRQELAGLSLTTHNQLHVNGEVDDSTELRVKKSIVVTASPTVVFDAFVSEEDAAVWMTAEVDIDPQTGGGIEIVLDGMPALSGTIVSMESPHNIIVRWVPGEWGVELTTSIMIYAHAMGSIVKLVEEGFVQDGDLLSRRDFLWSHWLVRLAAVIAGR